MSLLSIRQGLLRLVATAVHGRLPRSGSAGPPRPLAIESLEDRCLLSYTLTDLGTLGGLTSVARAINDAGQVVGDSQLAGSTAYHGFLYCDGRLKDLGTLQGNTSSANGINAAGEVAGASAHAFRDHDGTLTDLGTLGGPYSIGYGINTTGQVVGDAATGSANVTHAFLYAHGTMNDLGGFGGTLSHAYAINDAGEIVGSARNALEQDRAFRYRHGVMAELGTLGGDASWAVGVNQRGQVIGYSTISPGSFAPTHAFEYDRGRMTDLGTLGGEDSWAAAINDAGQVVGYSFNGNNITRAFLYYAGRIIDLNNLLDQPSGWVLYEALGINNRGQIVGEGRCPSGAEHAFLLTPDQRPSAPGSSPSLDPLVNQELAAASRSKAFVSLMDTGQLADHCSVPLPPLGQRRESQARPISPNGGSDPRSLALSPPARDALFALPVDGDLFDLSFGSGS